MEERSVDTSHSAAEQATLLLSSACESSPRRKGPTKVSFIENSRRRANCLNKRLKSFVKKVCLWEDAVCCPNLVLICWLFCFVNRERKFLQWRGARCFCLWKLAKAKNKSLSPGDYAWAESQGIPSGLRPGNRRTPLTAVNEHQSPIPAADLARPGSYVA